MILMVVMACPARAATADYVRLHVVADSNTAEAQAVKLRVRDAVLECARALLKDAKDADTAWRMVNENLKSLEEAARRMAQDVTCQAGVFPFPDRHYDGTLVPAGDYRALRVVIGAGKGRNWWCVLYPSLCYPEDWKTEDVALYSSLWRWLRSLFGGDGT